MRFGGELGTNWMALAASSLNRNPGKPRIPPTCSTSRLDRFRAPWRIFKSGFSIHRPPDRRIVTDIGLAGNRFVALPRVLPTHAVSASTSTDRLSTSQRPHVGIDLELVIHNMTLRLRLETSSDGLSAQSHPLVEPSLYHRPMPFRSHLEITGDAIAAAFQKAYRDKLRAKFAEIVSHSGNSQG